MNPFFKSLNLFESSLQFESFTALDRNLKEGEEISNENEILKRFSGGCFFVSLILKLYDKMSL